MVGMPVGMNVRRAALPPTTKTTRCFGSLCRRCLTRYRMVFCWRFLRKEKQAREQAWEASADRSIFPGLPG